MLEKLHVTTMEPVLKDYTIAHKNVDSQHRWSLVTGSITLECKDLLPRIYGLSRQVVSHASLSRYVSLYQHIVSI